MSDDFRSTEIYEAVRDLIDRAPRNVIDDARGPAIRRFVREAMGAFDINLAEVYEAAQWFSAFCRPALNDHDLGFIVASEFAKQRRKAARQ